MTAIIAPEPPEAAALPGQPRLARLWEAARQNKVGAVGAVVMIFFAIVAIFAPQLAPYDPLDTNFDAMLLPPGGAHFLGTDEFGRDLLSRIIYGGRTALFIGTFSATVSTAIGLALGVASAYFGGLFDLVLQRVIDLLMAFPTIVFALAMIALFGNEIGLLLMIITVVFIPGTVRITRSVALSICRTTYVDAAKALGYGPARIILRHIAPNLMGVALVIVTGKVGSAILLEAGLSYLGLGVQEPTPAWGLMLKGGSDQYIESAFWVPFYPGLAITLTVLAFCFFGDSLRDALDPRLRRE